MKNKLFSVLFALFVVVNTAEAQNKKIVTDLPDISVIGNFLGTHSNTKKSFEVKEIEFSFQHYLYPSVKANVYAAHHKEESGNRQFELEEAYVTFSDLFDVLFPNSVNNIGVGATIGKKLLSVGKINVLHPEQWAFTDRPLAVQPVLGGAEGLSAEGVQLQYLLPLPFFSQVELGYWTMEAAAHEDHGEGEDPGVEYSGRLLNGRLWNSTSLSKSQELELGFSYLLGNASAQSDTDKSNLLGADLSFTQDLDSGKTLKLHGEAFQILYGDEGKKREKQRGGFISAVYKFTSLYQTGIRFGTLGKHGNEGYAKTQWTINLTRQLTDTSKFRIQYNTGENIENIVYAQFIFGIGPHAHVLQ